MVWVTFEFKGEIAHANMPPADGHNNNNDNNLKDKYKYSIDHNPNNPIHLAQNIEHNDNRQHHIEQTDTDVTSTQATNYNRQYDRYLQNKELQLSGMRIWRLGICTSIRLECSILCRLQAGIGILRASFCPATIVALYRYYYYISALWKSGYFYPKQTFHQTVILSYTCPIGIISFSLISFIFYFWHQDKQTVFVQFINTIMININKYMIKVILVFSKSNFCQSKSYFWASQVITKAVILYKNSDSSLLSNDIFNAIDQSKKIEDVVKVQVKQMFDPHQGFNIPNNMKIIQRFSLSLNKQQKYAMNPNALMLKIAANSIFQFIQKQNKIRFAQKKCKLVYGTIGASKSCSFYNISKKINMKMPYLLKYDCPKDSIFQSHAKVFFLFSYDTQIDHLANIMNSVKQDCGGQGERYESLKRIYQEYIENMYRLSNTQRFKMRQLLIIQIFSFYRKRNIRVVIILDQFNNLYIQNAQDQQQQQLKKLMFIRLLYQKSDWPMFFISSKNISQLTKWKIDNPSKVQPLRMIVQSPQIVHNQNTDQRSNIKQKIRSCVYQVAFEMQKYGLEAKFIDEVIENLKQNMPYSTHLTIASAICQIIKFSYNAQEFSRSFLSELKKDVQRMKTNVQQNLKLMQLIVLFDSIDKQLQIKSEFVTSDKKKIAVNTTILYIDLHAYSTVAQQVKKLANINFFYQQSNKIYTSFNKKQISQLIKFFDHSNSQQINKIEMLYSLRGPREGRKFQKQIKLLISGKGINYQNYNKELGTQLLQFQIINKKEAAITAQSLQIFEPKSKKKIEYYKFPNITQNSDWQQRISQQQIFVSTSQSQIEPNLIIKYNWKQFITSFQRKCNYLSANNNNQAFDFILSFNIQGKLDLYFIDATVGKQSQPYIKKKCKQKREFINNQNFYILINQIHKSKKVKKINIYFYILFNQGCRFKSEDYSWDDYNSHSAYKWNQLFKLNKRFYLMKGSFGVQFNIFKGTKAFNLNDLKQYQKQYESLNKTK